MADCTNGCPERHQSINIPEASTKQDTHLRFFMPCTKLQNVTDKGIYQLNFYSFHKGDKNRTLIFQRKKIQIFTVWCSSLFLCTDFFRVDIRGFSLFDKIIWNWKPGSTKLYCHTWTNIFKLISVVIKQVHWLIVRILMTLFQRIILHYIWVITSDEFRRW